MSQLVRLEGKHTAQTAQCALVCRSWRISMICKRGNPSAKLVARPSLSKRRLTRSLFRNCLFSTISTTTCLKLHFRQFVFIQQLSCDLPKFLWNCLADWLSLRKKDNQLQKSNCCCQKRDLKECCATIASSWKASAWQSCCSYSTLFYFIFATFRFSTFYFAL